MARLGRAGRVLGWAGLAALTLLAQPVCKRPAGQPASVGLGAISVEPIPATGESTPLDRDALVRQVRTQLQQAGIFAREDPKRKEVTVVANVRIGLAMESVQADGKALARAVVRLQVATRPEGRAPAHLSDDSRASAEMLYPPDTEEGTVFQRLAERSIADLLASYVSRQKLWTADSSALRASLSTAGELRVEAIRVVAARKAVDEVPILLTLLNDEDETVRDAALGALVTMRDARAVPVLTKSRSMRDGREMGKIVEALAVLGGQEAVDYLAFVADTHESEEIRQLARQALQRAKGQARGR